MSKKKSISGILCTDLPYTPKKKRKQKGKASTSIALTENELYELLKILIRDNACLAAALGYNYLDTLQQHSTNPPATDTTLPALEEGGNEP